MRTFWKPIVSLGQVILDTLHPMQDLRVLPILRMRTFWKPIVSQSQVVLRSEDVLEAYSQSRSGHSRHVAPHAGPSSLTDPPNEDILEAYSQSKSGCSQIGGRVGSL